MGVTRTPFSSFHSSSSSNGMRGRKRRAILSNHGVLCSTRRTSTTQFMRLERERNLEEEATTETAETAETAGKTWLSYLSDEDRKELEQGRASCGGCRGRAAMDQRRTQGQQSAGAGGKGVRSTMRNVACMLACLQIGSGAVGVEAASAILKGNPNAKIPRNPAAALRRSTPAVNTEMAEIQKKLEDVAFLLRIPQRKQWDKMEEALNECRDRLVNNRSKILVDVQEKDLEEANVTLDSMDVAFQQVLRGIAYKDAPYSGKYLNAALNNVNAVELAQVAGLPYNLPRNLREKYPILTGRAQLRLTIKKGSKSDRLYVLDNETRQDSVGTCIIELDGFSAPVTSGQLLINAKKGLYDGITINQDLNASALLVNPKSPTMLERQSQADNLPLEIFEVGQFEPSYNITLDVLNMEYPVLPMSIFGAVVMSHDNTNVYKSSSENFFIYKFDESMGGLAGLSFDEGQFSVVGYVTGGSDLIEQVENGDVVEKVEILSGEEKLKIPLSMVPAPAPAPVPVPVQQDEGEKVGAVGEM